MYLDIGHTWVGFGPIVRSMFGFDGPDRWRYPLDLSYIGIQNASGSSQITPAGSGEDNYNMDIEWATAHTPFDTDIVDLGHRYEVTVRSTSTDQTADITPRRTSAFNVTAGDSCAWTCLLYTSPSPRDRQKSRMPSSA